MFTLTITPEMMRDTTLIEKLANAVLALRTAPIDRKIANELNSSDVSEKVIKNVADGITDLAPADTVKKGKKKATPEIPPPIPVPPAIELPIPTFGAAEIPLPPPPPVEAKPLGYVAEPATYPEFVKNVSFLMASGKLKKEEINTALSTFGVTSLVTLGTQLDLVPVIWAQLKEKIK